MYLRNTSNEVKDLIEKVNELDKENKMKYILYILDLWDKNQINSLNKTNPDLLDDSIDINIFNPSSIEEYYLVNQIKEYWNIKYNLYQLYLKEYKELIPLFENLSFKEKIDIIVELFLILEHDELLPDNIDGYNIATLITKY
ncbi:MAG: hypothetical protein E7163_00130 [Firmicutes bacterium]|nr:hypothetical protein [Bacillota bacterium]